MVGSALKPFLTTGGHCVRQIVRGDAVSEGSISWSPYEETIDLSPTEFRLLQVLVENKNRVLSKSLLLDEVWGITFESESTVADTYISYMRKKLHKDGFEGIKTVRGVGFVIQDPK